MRTLPALLLVPVLLAAAGTAAAQDSLVTSPLLTPPPSLAPDRYSPAPRQLTPLEAEKARSYRDELDRTERQLDYEDSRGRLDPARQQDLRNLRAEQRRLDGVLAAPVEPAPGTPSSEDLRQTLPEEPLAGTQHRRPTLGHGGATLKPGRQEPVPPQKRQLEKRNGGSR